MQVKQKLRFTELIHVFVSCRCRGRQDYLPEIYHYRTEKKDNLIIIKSRPHPPSGFSSCFSNVRQWACQTGATL